MGEIAFHILGQDDVEHGNRIENSVAPPKDADQPLKRLRRRDEKIADQSKALREDEARVIAQIFTGNA